jgi:hypothetical protein
MSVIMGNLGCFQPRRIGFRPGPSPFQRLSPSAQDSEDPADIVSAK